MISADGRLECRFCNGWIDPQELTFVNAYWVGRGSYIRSFEHPDQVIRVAAEPKWPSHRSCAKEGKRREAYDCQSIDAACNDCLHFHREGTYPKPANPFTTTERISDEKQKAYLIAVIMSGNHFGQCLKFNKPVNTSSQMAELNPCFEHRRAAEYRSER